MPLCLDLTNPSAGIGWGNRERDSLSSRGPADLANISALKSGMPDDIITIGKFLAHPTAWGQFVGTASMMAGIPMSEETLEVTGATPFDGSAVVLNSYLPTDRIFFGDLNAYYTRIAQDFQTMVISERYVLNHQVGYVSTVRANGQLVHADAVKYMTIV